MPRSWSALALGAVLGAMAVAMPAQGAGEELTSSWAQINICKVESLNRIGSFGYFDDATVRLLQVRTSSAK